MRAAISVAGIGMLAIFSAGFAGEPAPAAAPGPLCIPTFHCIGIYWSPEGGTPEKNVLVKYRASDQKDWREALPMRYNPIKTPECKGTYRGSIVNLLPDTHYEISLSLENTQTTATLSGTTWSEQFPIASTVKCEPSAATLEVNQSGKPNGYVLYDGKGVVIDGSNKIDLGISVNASYVILRGFTIKNVKQHGIKLLGGTHIVIEDCDISKWGSEKENGFGVDQQAGVWCRVSNVTQVVIQRCSIHHPSWNTNSWAVKRSSGSSHPSGPQTIVFWESQGNHVFRYNELWSDPEHYFNDTMGGGSNSSYTGFPGADSDIYFNYVANCWDDAIEAEGGGQNVRIWGNYIENSMMALGNASVTVGPLYFWNNVGGAHTHHPAAAMT